MRKRSKLYKCGIQKWSKCTLIGFLNRFWKCKFHFYTFTSSVWQHWLPSHRHICLQKNKSTKIRVAETHKKCFRFCFSKRFRFLASASIPYSVSVSISRNAFPLFFTNNFSTWILKLIKQKMLYTIFFFLSQNSKVLFYSSSVTQFFKIEFETFSTLLFFWLY